MKKTEAESRTVPAILGICKFENGNICVYSVNTDYPELSFAVEMEPENARRFIKSMTDVIDEKVFAGDSEYIRAEQIKKKSKKRQEGRE